MDVADSGEGSSLKVLVLDALWRERPEDEVPPILGGLKLHQEVLRFMNKRVFTIGLSSDPPVFKHRVTYTVRQGFGRPLRLEFYKYLVRLLITFLKVVRAHRPHIIYNPGIGWHNDWLALFAKLLNMKVVSYFHHYSLPRGSLVYPRSFLDLPRLREMCKEIKRVSRFPFFKLLDYLASFQQLKMADIVFTGSGFGVDQLRRLGRRKTTVVTGIGIDLEEFQEDPSNEDQKIWDGLFVGRMAPEKGVFDLLWIWRKVVGEIPEAKLAVAGKIVQPYYNKWLKMREELNLEENVVHLGELERKELIKTYYSSKVFVFPSKIEGAGIVVAEAMAAGLPIVARNLPTYEILYGDAPALYCFDNLENMAAKVIELIGLRSSVAQIGMKNREYALRKFSWENVARRILGGLQLFRVTTSVLY